MALSPKVLAVLKKVDAVHAEFFAVLERESANETAARRRPRRSGPQAATPPRRPAKARGQHERGVRGAAVTVVARMVVESIRRTVEGIPAPVGRRARGLLRL